MSLYKYRIVKKDQWRFELLPNNSNHQYVGYSGNYPSKEKAIEGIYNFKNFLYKQGSKAMFVMQTTKTEDTIYYFATIKFYENNEMFSIRKSDKPKEIEKRIKRVLDNFNVSIREDLTRIEGK